MHKLNHLTIQEIKSLRDSNLVFCEYLNLYKGPVECSWVAKDTLKLIFVNEKKGVLNNKPYIFYDYSHDYKSRHVKLFKSTTKYEYINEKNF